MTNLPPEESVASMDRRTKICIWIILIGMTNFLAYTVSYSIIGGEAVLGSVEYDTAKNKVVYHLTPKGKPEGVHRDMFIYSGIHSISIWPTVMAVMLAMLTLAKDRIAGSVRSSVVTGRSLISILAVIISISTAGLTFLFLRQFMTLLSQASSLAAKAATMPATLPI